jgi:hypothetical protein
MALKNAPVLNEPATSLASAVPCSARVVSFCPGLLAWALLATVESLQAASLKDCVRIMSGQFYHLFLGEHDPKLSELHRAP